MNRPEPRKKRKYKSPYKKGGHRRIIAKENNMVKIKTPIIKLDARSIRKLLDEEPNLTIEQFKKRIGYKKDKK